jgi:hypothetical protein
MDHSGLLRLFQNSAPTYQTGCLLRIVFHLSMCKILNKTSHLPKLVYNYLDHKYCSIHLSLDEFWNKTWFVTVIVLSILLYIIVKHFKPVRIFTTCFTDKFIGWDLSIFSQSLQFLLSLILPLRLPIKILFVFTLSSSRDKHIHY